MADFRSALYLGLRHPHASLRPWNRLTLGLPAALEPPDGAVTVARHFARTLGYEAATLGTSTLHIFWDLFEVLAAERIAIYMDAGLYPVVRWGVERVAAKGVPAVAFNSHDPAALEALLERDRQSGNKPVVVTDGLCPATGRTAPLAQYLKLIRERNGYLVIDDTQALGILGRGPATSIPYGRGGGGTPAWHGIRGPELIVGSSMAKGFGVPLGVLAGSGQVISKFESLGSTRVHCSPPSAALVSAAQGALAINGDQGDSLRGRLLKLVRFFRERLRQIGLGSTGGFFPVQTLKPIPGVDTVRLHEYLSGFGIKTVLHAASNGHAPRLSFFNHRPAHANRN